ncbi:MAG: preprotein translocase subunit YajC [Deltaproteobacteria bacterium]|nr:preprotein translocase subunit YajC [Deltaproteobacteria bacterium]
MIDLAYAMALPGGEGGDANALMGFLPMILIFAVFYFLLIRPQQKKAKERRALLDNLKKGDAIITQGGLHGKIVSIADQVLTVEIAPKIQVKISRSHVAGVGGTGGTSSETSS